MIRRLSANESTFKAIAFSSGLNVLLAERDTKSTNTHSRNARGKTTVIQAINFCLAGNLIKPMQPLSDQGWEFTTDLDFPSSRVAATRAVGQPTRVQLSWEHPPTTGASGLSTDESIAVADWKSTLGTELFGLEDTGEASGLSARTLLSYVIRVDSSKDPVKIIPQQSAVSAREHISYFVGLDWTTPSNLERVRKADEALRGLQYITNENLLPGLPSEEAILLRLPDLQNQRGSLEQKIRSFNVVDDAEGIVYQADQLTRELVTLRDASLIDRRLIAMYQDSTQLSDAEQISVANVEALYSDIGRTFTAEATNELSAVAEFHAALSRNRESYIQRELAQLVQQQTERASQIDRLERERARLMQVLSSSGAIDELVSLQEALTSVVAEVSEATSALRTIRETKRRRQDYRLERAELRSAATHDVATLQSDIDELSAIFSGLLQRLYGRGGVVSIDVDDYGPRIKVTGDSAVSAGVTKMILVCFDLALMVFAHPRGRHPGFLVHDSIVFDGVDSRQVTEALKMIAEVTTETGTQYICTLNSDAVLAEDLESEWFRAVVRREVLDTEVGGFLGVSF